jgi:hypothetical protein
MDLLEHLGHWHSGLVVRECLKSVEHFPSDDLFAGARNQPVVEENRGSRMLISVSQKPVSNSFQLLWYASSTFVPASSNFWNTKFLIS